MRSQELIQIHALLVEVRANLEQEGTVPAGAFSAYDAQPTGPVHIHQSKENHKYAISLLTEGVNKSIQTRSSRTSPSIQ